MRACVFVCVGVFPRVRVHVCYDSLSPRVADKTTEWTSSLPSTKSHSKFQTCSKKLSCTILSTLQAYQADILRALLAGLLATYLKPRLKQQESKMSVHDLPCTF
eukprot:1157598-Pelagomonas_calceolata.AAC.4